MGEGTKIGKITPARDKDSRAQHDLDRDPETKARRARLQAYRQANSGVMQGWRVEVNGSSSRGTIKRFHPNGYIVVRYDNLEVDSLVDPQDVHRTVQP